MSKSSVFHTACPSCEYLSLVVPQELDASGGRVTCPDCGLRYRAEEHWVELMDYRPRRSSLFTGHDEVFGSPDMDADSEQVPVFGEQFSDTDPSPPTPVTPPASPATTGIPETGKQVKGAAFKQAFGDSEQDPDNDLNFEASLSIPGLLNTSKLKEEFHFLGTEQERKKAQEALAEANREENDDIFRDDHQRIDEAEEQDVVPPESSYMDGAVPVELSEQTRTEKSAEAMGDENPAPHPFSDEANTDMPPRKVKTANEPVASRSFEFHATFEQPVDPDRPRRLTTRGGPNRHQVVQDELVSSFSDLDPPVEMETDDSGPLWQKLLPMAGSVFMVVLLSVQYVLFHAAEMQREGSMPWLTGIACSVVTCSAPEASSADDYDSRLLQIRSHPRAEDALQVIFAFSNISGREVPFPNVELVFFARDNQTVVASRKFLPYEYLPRDTNRPDLMPSGTQMQAELEISDPGPRAVNYIIRFSR